MKTYKKLDKAMNKMKLKTAEKMTVAPLGDVQFCILVHMHL